MTARDVKRSALGMGRILLGVIMALVGPMWLVSALVDYTRPTVPTNNLVAPSVEVHDETGSFEPIDGRPLTDALGDVKFTRPIHLVILSTDDLVDDNLDEATLKYARARHQEWISPNGYKWADGYLILSLSPTHRKVGTYFGEDIAPLLFVQEEIQDAAKDDFRAGRWSQGMVAAATKAAAYIPNEAGYSIKNRVVWPHWTGWLVSLTGIGVLLRGHSLRRTVRESSERIAEAWEETEERRSEVERAFHSIVDAGHYSKGLTARYGCAHQERKKVRERVAVLKSPGFFGSLSAGAASEREELLEDIELLSAADDAIFAARDFFALAPRWRDLWDNEVGPVFEDLSAADSISVKVRNRVKKHQVKNAVEAFNRWTNEQRDIIVGLGVSPEYADITPVQALNELDRIADESRARLTTLIGQALVADTSSSGRQRYEHWESNSGGTVGASDVLYKGTYLSSGDLHEYNPASTIRLTANSAGVRLTGKAAEKSGRFQANNVSVWAYPTYLDRYVDYDQFSGLRFVLGRFLGLWVLLVLLTLVRIPGDRGLFVPGWRHDVSGNGNDESCTPASSFDYAQCAWLCAPRGRSGRAREPACSYCRCGFDSVRRVAERRNGSGSGDDRRGFPRPDGCARRNDGRVRSLRTDSHLAHGMGERAGSGVRGSNRHRDDHGNCPEPKHGPDGPEHGCLPRAVAR